MYRIETESWGVLLTFSGNVTLEEAKKYDKELILVRAKLAGKPYHIICDCQSLGVMAPEVQGIFKKSQEDGKKSGMVRSCVILSAPIPIMYAKRFAKETGIYEWERYIDGRGDPNWKKKALDWVCKGIDPDKTSS
jgi:hypothetical protein